MPSWTLFRADSRRSPGRVFAIGLTFFISAVILSVTTLLTTQLLTFHPHTGDLTGKAAAILVRPGEEGDDQTVAPTPEQIDRAERAVAGKATVVGWQDRWLSVMKDGRPVPAPAGFATRVTSMAALTAAGIPCEGSVPGRGEIAMSQALARQLGVTAGATVSTTSAAGTKDRKVSCLAPLDDSLAIQLAAAPEELAAEPGSHAPSSLFVYPREGVSPASVVSTLTNAGLGGLVIGKPADFVPQGTDKNTQQAAMGAVQMFSIDGSFVVIAACIVLAIVISLWARQRFGDLTVLRALGTSRGRIRGLVVGDVLRICVPLALLALPVSWFVAQAFGRWLVNAKLAPEFMLHQPVTKQSMWVLAATCAATILLSVVVALSSAIAAGRLEPASLLREGNAMAVEGKGIIRLIAACGFLLTTGVLLIMLAIMPEVIAPAIAPMLSMQVIPAMALLAPWLSRPLAWLMSKIALIDGRPGWLAGHNLRFNRVRTAALFGPALLAVGLATVLLNSGTSVDRIASAHFRDSAKVPTVALPAGTALLPLAAADSGDAEMFVPGRYNVPEDSYMLSDTLVFSAVEPQNFAKAVDLGVKEGRGLDTVNGHEMVMSSVRLKAFGLRVGQQVEIIFEDGQPETFTIVGTFPRYGGHADVYAPREIVAPHSLDPGVSQVYGPRGDIPTAMLVDVPTVAKSFTRSGIDLAALMGIALLIAAYPILAMATTAALAQSDQLRQHATVRMVGADRWQLFRQICWESGGAGLMGAAVGFAFAWVVLLPAARLANLAVPPLDPVWTPAVFVATVLAAVAPALLAARPLRPIQEVASSR